MRLTIFDHAITLVKFSHEAVWGAMARALWLFFFSTLFVPLIKLYILAHSHATTPLSIYSP